MTQQEVADALGWETTKGTIAKLENRAMALSLDYILGIAQALGAHPAEIIDGSAGSNGRKVPVLGAVAAGNWREAIGFSDETITIPDSLRGPNLFALRVDGDSMDRVVPDGGLAVIDPDDLSLIDGRIYVVCNSSHETTMKRYRASPASLIPVSNNPSHKPIEIGREAFQTIGRAIYALQPL